MRHSTFTLLSVLTLFCRSGFAQTAPVSSAVPANSPSPPPGYVYVPTAAPPTPAPAGYPSPPPGYGYVPAPTAPQLRSLPQSPPTTTGPNTSPTVPPSSQPRLIEGEKRRTSDPRQMTVGIAPLVSANVHWLDQPEKRRVAADGVYGEDRTYPGFVGGDIGFGLMVDFRFKHFIGAEIDIIYQNDRGTGTVETKGRGSICYLPNSLAHSTSTDYEVTIGQRAWHIPVLFKLSVPGKELAIEETAHIRLVPQTFTTIAFGPEFVLPETAKLEIAPTGLSYPIRATASQYIMYTGSLGWERRIAKTIDLRVIASLRGSFNPGPKNSAQRRGQYAAVNGTVQPVAYKSEWRFQAAGSLGLGWFF